MRVAEALHELPAVRAAFSRGELTFTKVRALTRVATATSEEGLLELAGALTASQLDRALRAFRRLAVEDARETHELEFVDYHFEEDGSLYLPRALPPRTARCSSRRWKLCGSGSSSGDVRSDPLRETTRLQATPLPSWALRVRGPRASKRSSRLPRRHSPRPTSSDPSARGWWSTSMLQRCRPTAAGAPSWKTAR